MNKWYPKYTPSSESCRIQTFDEIRARLTAGGTFFRSKDIGSQWNGVNIQLLVTSLTMGGFNNPSPTTHIRWDNSWTVSTDVVELTVTHTFTNYLDYYYVEQGEVEAMPPPACSIFAINDLRTQVNNDINGIIEMPTNDIPANWNASVNEDSICLLTPFNLTLSGGQSGPVGAIGVRTGPEKAIIFVNQSEKNSPVGTLEAVRQLREYNGSIWIPFTGN